MLMSDRPSFLESREPVRGHTFELAKERIVDGGESDWIPARSEAICHPRS